MKQILFILLCIFIIPIAFGQKEGAIWYFGTNAGLDFNNGAPVALNNSTHSINEGCASISTAKGSLLFYTDGIKSWNKHNEIMPNGEGLLGHSSSTQSAIIVPHPGNLNKYYLFTVNANYHLTGKEGLNYSVIDITLDDGNGDIIHTEKNIELLPIVEEKITAIKKSDTEYWVVSRYYDTFYTFKIDINGLNPIPIETKIEPILHGALDNFFGINSQIGYMKFSPDGSKLAIAFYDYIYPIQNYKISLGGVFLLDFNIDTGIPSNPQLLSEFFRPYGLEFSPDSSKLFVGTGFAQLVPSNPNGIIYQFDLYSPNIANSKTAVLNLDYGYYLSALQLAIDGKIYFSTLLDTEVFTDPGIGSDFMSVINNPNADVANLDINLDIVPLNGGSGRYGLPTFIASIFNVGLTYNNTCLGDVTEFAINSTEEITSIAWDFGDGNTSSLETPSHTYATPGNYTVSVTVSTLTETITKTKEINIYTFPVSHPIDNVEFCKVGADFTFDLSAKNPEILGSQSDTEFDISYYLTLANAEANTNRLPNLFTAATGMNTTVYARITNANNSACYALTSFDLIVKQAPVLSPVSDWVVCDTYLDGFHTFNLTDKNVEVLGGQNATLFSVSYFETLADAQSGIAPLSTTYTNTAASKELFFRIENTASPECFLTGSFLLEVVMGVTATAPNDLEVCDNNNDGLSTFDLSLQNATVLGAQNPAAHTVSYHPSLTDAEAGTNALNTTAYTNTVPFQETLFVRVVNNSNSDCYAITQFDIRVYDSPVQQMVSPWMVCDLDNDVFHSFDLSEKDTEVLGGQSPIDFEIAYFHTEQDAVSSQNPILGVFQNTSNPQQLFYRIQNRNNAACFLTDSFSLHLFDAPIAYVPEPLILCDTNETGILSIDLSPKDVEVLGRQDPNYYVVSYFSSEQDAVTNASVLSKQNYNNTELQETLFARIQHRELTSCYEVTQFSLTINPLPIPAVQEVYVICPDSPELVIDGGDFESWVWEDSGGTVVGTSREFNVAALGDYSLTVSQTNDGVRCENTLFFEVVSSGAPEAFIAAVEGFSDQVTISIEVTGIGNFEYSIDGENYQDQARFEVFPGEYTAYVRDKLLCRTLSQEIIALGYQKFFTPNGDDLHEHWNVIGADSFPEAQVYIYDRYGKLVQQLSPTDHGWNGTYKGVPLPSADYWFRFIYGNGKVFSGHFSLKR